eukprot:TRINITY_DN6540_c0_g1_i1.p1 TRINITY_DN6540_c0_g1~~TRINITY_DN6540_c0_g1_i1.p1  ORF type:complete len:271 (+),score=48.36 TRINITY_DN6540_c0_g1_i1:95-814(+)
MKHKWRGITCATPKKEDQNLPLPPYLVETYTWAYLTPTGLLLDNPFVPNAILWGNMSRLVKSSCSEFNTGDSVLQAANVYGHLSTSLAETLGHGGSLDLIDIAPIQVAHAKKKLAHFPQVQVRQADARNPGHEMYQGALSFFLLHEVPDDYKTEIVNALLSRVEKGGKVVFVDYHMPLPFHPLRLLMMFVFKILEPFAIGLIRKDIKDFSCQKIASSFQWNKETYFWGLYQKVVATRKE